MENFTASVSQLETDTAVRTLMELQNGGSSERSLGEDSGYCGAGSDRLPDFQDMEEIQQGDTPHTIELNNALNGGSNRLRFFQPMEFRNFDSLEENEINSYGRQSEGSFNNNNSGVHLQPLSDNMRIIDRWSGTRRICETLEMTHVHSPFLEQDTLNEVQPETCVVDRQIPETFRSSPGKKKCKQMPFRKVSSLPITLATTKDKKNEEVDELSGIRTSDKNKLLEYETEGDIIPNLTGDNGPLQFNQFENVKNYNTNIDTSKYGIYGANSTVGSALITNISDSNRNISLTSNSETKEGASNTYINNDFVTYNHQIQTISSQINPSQPSIIVPENQNLEITDFSRWGNSAKSVISPQFENSNLFTNCDSLSDYFSEPAKDNIPFEMAEIKDYKQNCFGNHNEKVTKETAPKNSDVFAYSNASNKNSPPSYAIKFKQTKSPCDVIVDRDYERSHKLSFEQSQQYFDDPMYVPESTVRTNEHDLFRSMDPLMESGYRSLSSQSSPPSINSVNQCWTPYSQSSCSSADHLSTSNYNNGNKPNFCLPVKEEIDDYLYDSQNSQSHFNQTSFQNQSNNSFSSYKTDINYSDTKNDTSRESIGKINSSTDNVNIIKKGNMTQSSFDSPILPISVSDSNLYKTSTENSSTDVKPSLHALDKDKDDQLSTFATIIHNALKPTADNSITNHTNPSIISNIKRKTASRKNDGPTDVSVDKFKSNCSGSSSIGRSSNIRNETLHFAHTDEIHDPKFAYDTSKSCKQESFVKDNGSKDSEIGIAINHTSTDPVFIKSPQLPDQKHLKRHPKRSDHMPTLSKVDTEYDFHSTNDMSADVPILLSIDNFQTISCKVEESDCEIHETIVSEPDICSDLSGTNNVIKNDIIANLSVSLVRLKPHQIENTFEKQPTESQADVKVEQPVDDFSWETEESVNSEVMDISQTFNFPDPLLFNEPKKKPSRKPKRKNRVNKDSIILKKLRSASQRDLSSPVRERIELPPPKSNKTSNSLQCDFCSKTYVRDWYFAKHVRSHWKMTIYLCTICGDGFNSKSARNSHLLKHSSEKVFSCPMCEKIYKRQCNYKKHAKTHGNLSTTI